MKQVKETGRIGKGERTNKCHLAEGTPESWEDMFEAVGTSYFLGLI